MTVVKWDPSINIAALQDRINRLFRDAFPGPPGPEEEISECNWSPQVDILETDDGIVIHAEVVKTGTQGTPGTFGYPDFPNWVPPGGNVGRPGTDFSQFQAFQRGVIVIKMEYDNLPDRKPQKLTGYVASIPVGLNSVGSVVLNSCDSKQSDHVNCFKVGAKAKKGKTKFGNFFFGGSLNSQDLGMCNWAQGIFPQIARLQ